MGMNSSGNRRIVSRRAQVWEGAERRCGHRCERRRGPCGWRPAAEALESVLDELPPEDRAAAERFLAASRTDVRRLTLGGGGAQQWGGDGVEDEARGVAPPLPEGCE